MSPGLITLWYSLSMEGSARRSKWLHLTRLSPINILILTLTLTLFSAPIKYGITGNTRLCCVCACSMCYLEGCHSLCSLHSILSFQKTCSPTTVQQGCDPTAPRPGCDRGVSTGGPPFDPLVKAILNQT